MNNEYWKNFYQQPQTREPTDFARFCRAKMPTGARVIDFGCGNGRDSLYFAAQGFPVVGVDENLPSIEISPSPKNTLDFQKSSLTDYILAGKESENGAYRPCDYDVVYSRFFLHAIELEEIDHFIRWSHNLWMAEFRAAGDQPILYPNHKRTYVSEVEIRDKLQHAGFQILHSETGYGLARWRHEDPLIVRVIAMKDSGPQS